MPLTPFFTMPNLKLNRSKMSATAATIHEYTAMETREASPAHFLFKIESFSSLKNLGIDKYETKEFVAGDQKWRLIIYPNGDENVGKDRDYVSVHLAIADKKSLPANWEVNAVFSIFLFNHNSGNYLCSLGITRRFQGMKSQWGFSKFISKKTMSDTSNGFLMNDICVFGAEVFIVRSNAVTGCLSLKSVEIPYKRDWKISNLSQVLDVWKSEEFSVGGHKWKLWVYPKGDGGQVPGRCVSIFLNYFGCRNVMARFTVQIKNHLPDREHIKATSVTWFSGSNSSWGWSSFVKLATINDPKKGFIVNDTCLLDLQISVQAVAE